MPIKKSEYPSELAINILIARKRKGLTQTGMVDALRARGYYITNSGYASLEAQNKSFRLEFLQLVADICGINPGFFFIKRGGVWDAAEVVRKAKEETSGNAA